MVCLFIFARCVKDLCNKDIKGNCVNTTSKILNDDSTLFTGLQMFCFFNFFFNIIFIVF